MKQIRNKYLHLGLLLPRSFMIISMVLADSLGILSAVLLAGLIRWKFMGSISISMFIWVPAYLVAFFFVANQRGLYPGTGLSSVDQFQYTTNVITLLTLILVAITFVVKVSDDISRLLLGLSWFFSLATVPFFRTVIRHFMVVVKWWGEPVVIIGCASQVKILNNYFDRNTNIGLKPMKTITLPGLISELAETQRKNLIVRARKLGLDYRIHTVLVAYEEMGEFESIREVFLDLFKRVALVNPSNFGVDLGGVTVRQYGDMLFFEVKHMLMDRFAQFQKRMIDLFIAGLGLLITFPFLSIIALIIALNSPGGLTNRQRRLSDGPPEPASADIFSKVFYKQDRLGKYGKKFQIIKFRTMHPHANKRLNDYLKQNPERRKEWDHYQKLANDPRVTSVGRWLRRFSLDELPQLWNVLMNEMSIVGPRPIMVSQHKLYGENFKHYIRVGPGITGLWQISGRNHTSFAVRTDYDVQYVMNWSIWMDIFILLRTIWVVLRREGAN